MKSKNIAAKQGAGLADRQKKYLGCCHGFTATIIYTYNNID